MSDTLIPCPFCGDEDVALHPNDLATCGKEIGQPNVDCFFVHCDCCGADGPPTESEHESILNWNRRATLQQQASRLDAAENLVERLVLRLREIRIAYAMNPSCQRGVIDDCCCVKCANAATDEALTEAAKWREGK